MVILSTVSYIMYCNVLYGSTVVLYIYPVGTTQTTDIMDLLRKGIFSRPKIKLFKHSVEFTIQ